MMTSAQMAPFLALQEVVASMLQAAQAEEWEQFVQYQQQHTQLSQALPTISWETLNPSQQKELVTCLENVRQMLDAVVPLTEKWRDELAGMLSSIQNSNKLNRAYRP